MPALRCTGKGCPGSTWKGYWDSRFLQNHSPFFPRLQKEKKGKNADDTDTRIALFLNASSRDSRSKIN
jgi:hypothetical protein